MDVRLVVPAVTDTLTHIDRALFVYTMLQSPLAIFDSTVMTGGEVKGEWTVKQRPQAIHKSLLYTSRAAGSKVTCAVPQ